MNRKLKMGMIGGGAGAFIGAVHRIAANMDGLTELVCGALSSDAEKARESARALFIPENRIYNSYHDMFQQEKSLPAGERMDFVSIVTPNDTHFEPAMLALENGFHVVIEKPLTLNLQEALALQQKVQETGLLLLLTHTYAGYPMIKQARHMVRGGKLGKIRKVIVEYPQGWLARQLLNSADLTKVWRTKPEKSGASGCIADIGTHAAHLAEYVTGHKITEICAQLNTFGEGNQLDDDGTMLLKMEDHVSGLLLASQIAAGEENPLKLRVYGENGGLEWSQHEPNTLLVKWVNRPAEIYRAGSRYTDILAGGALFNIRTPGGHPEGYLEAFANLYKNFALTLSARIEGRTPPEAALDFPSIDDGVRGMAFIETVLASHASELKWTVFNDPAATFSKHTHS